MAATVNTEHPKYSKMLSKWKRCRDTVSGSDAVKEAGPLYLPRLKDQTDDDYNAYKLRASFFNATWRTVSALAGMLFRKPPEIKVAASVEKLLEDVTTDGKSLHIFAAQTAIEVLTSGRMGILIDYPQNVKEGLSLAEAQNMNLRPSMQMYYAENIINWKVTRIGNENKLTLLVLKEDSDLPGNEFEHKKETHYRVLDLAVRPASPGSEASPGPVYRVRVFRIDDKNEDEQIGSDLYPLMNGKPLKTIPFVFIGIDDTTPSVDEPPLIDLVDVNLDHYRINADYKHGIHFTGLPTPVVSGYIPENKGDKLYIGSSSAWVFPDKDAKATFLEFTGQGLEAIVKAMEQDEQQMAILGARLLTSEKKATETSQTAQIHRAGESSILSSIAQTISIGLTQALKTFSEWAGSPDAETYINLNKEFVPAEIEPQELTAWVGAQQQGVVSHQVVFWNLQKREAIPPGMTFEEMQSQIGESPIPRPEGAA